MSLDRLPPAHLRVLLDGLPVFERYGLLLAGGYAFRARSCAGPCPGQRQGTDRAEHGTVTDDYSVRRAVAVREFAAQLAGARAPAIAMIRPARARITISGAE